MSRLRVFYAQTPSNEKLFRKLIEVGRLQGMDFVPLEDAGTSDRGDNQRNSKTQTDFVNHQNPT